MRLFDSKRSMTVGLGLAFAGLILGIAIGATGKTETAAKTGEVAAPRPEVTVTMTETVIPQVTITNTVQYTAPPAPTYQAIQTLEGRGEKQTDPFEIPSTAARWRICYSFRGGTNAQMSIIDGATGAQLEVIFNEIGDFQDCTTRYEPTGHSYALQVCCGRWSISIEITG